MNIKIKNEIEILNNFSNILKTFWNNVNIPDDFNTDECWEWNGPLNNHGYGVFVFLKTDFRAHRFIYQIYKREIPRNLCVRHLCNNRKCVNLYHLVEGTNYENVQDRVRAGRSAKGSKSGKSKFTEDTVHEILFKIVNNEFYSISDCARYYEVDDKTIHAILNGKTWKHVTDLYIDELSKIKDLVNYKISSDIIIELKKDIKGGLYTYEELSKKYGISTSAVGYYKFKEMKI